MVTFLGTVFKGCNGLMVRIPKRVLDSASIKDRDEVEVQLSLTGVSVPVRKGSWLRGRGATAVVEPGKV